MKFKMRVAIGAVIVESVQSVLGLSTALGRKPPTEPPAGVKKYEGEENKGDRLNKPPIPKEEPLKREVVVLDLIDQRKMNEQMYGALDLALNGSTTVLRKSDIIGMDALIPLRQMQDRSGRDITNFIVVKTGDQLTIFEPVYDSSGKLNKIFKATVPYSAALSSELQKIVNDSVANPKTFGNYEMDIYRAIFAAREIQENEWKLRPAKVIKVRYRSPDGRTESRYGSSIPVNLEVEIKIKVESRKTGFQQAFDAAQAAVDGLSNSSKLDEVTKTIDLIAELEKVYANTPEAEADMKGYYSRDLFKVKKSGYQKVQDLINAKLGLFSNLFQDNDFAAAYLRFTRGPTAGRDDVYKRAKKQVDEVLRLLNEVRAILDKAAEVDSWNYEVSIKVGEKNIPFVTLHGEIERLSEEVNAAVRVVVGKPPTKAPTPTKEPVKIVEKPKEEKEKPSAAKEDKKRSPEESAYNNLKTFLDAGRKAIEGINPADVDAYDRSSSSRQVVNDTKAILADKTKNISKKDELIAYCNLLDKILGYKEEIKLIYENYRIFNVDKKIAESRIGSGDTAYIGTLISEVNDLEKKIMRDSKLDAVAKRKLLELTAAADTFLDTETDKIVQAMADKVVKGFEQQITANSRKATELSDGQLKAKGADGKTEIERIRADLGRISREMDGSELDETQKTRLRTQITEISAKLNERQAKWQKVAEPPTARETPAELVAAHPDIKSDKEMAATSLLEGIKEDIKKALTKTVNLAQVRKDISDLEKDLRDLKLDRKIVESLSAELAQLKQLVSVVKRDGIDLYRIPQLYAKTLSTVDIQVLQRRLRIQPEEGEYRLIACFFTKEGKLEVLARHNTKETVASRFSITEAQLAGLYKLNENELNSLLRQIVGGRAEEAALLKNLILGTGKDPITVGQLRSFNLGQKGLTEAGPVHTVNKTVTFPAGTVVYAPLNFVDKFSEMDTAGQKREIDAVVAAQGGWSKKSVGKFTFQAAQKELDAISDAVKKFKDGKKEPLAYLVFRYMQSTTTAGADAHLTDLTVYLMYELQKQGAIDFTINGLFPPVLNGKKLKTVTGAEDILERAAKGAVGKKEVVAFLQQWQNLNLGELDQTKVAKQQAVLFTHVVGFLGKYNRAGPVYRYLKELSKGNRKLITENVVDGYAGQLTWGAFIVATLGREKPRRVEPPERLVERPPIEASPAPKTRKVTLELDLEDGSIGRGQGSNLEVSIDEVKFRDPKGLEISGTLDECKDRLAELCNVKKEELKMTVEWVVYMLSKDGKYGYIESAESSRIAKTRWKAVMDFEAMAIYEIEGLPPKSTGKKIGDLVMKDDGTATVDMDSIDPAYKSKLVFETKVDKLNVEKAYLEYSKQRAVARIVYEEPVVEVSE